MRFKIGLEVGRRVLIILAFRPNNIFDDIFVITFHSLTLVKILFFSLSLTRIFRSWAYIVHPTAVKHNRVNP